MIANTTPSRLDRIKHRQAAAQAGVRGAALRAHGVEGADPDAHRRNRRANKEAYRTPAPGHVDAEPKHVHPLEIDLMAHFDAAAEEALVTEFDEVLAAIGEVHGYEAEDAKFVRGYYLPVGVDLFVDLRARAEVKERIRSWMVDLVTFAWEARPEQEHLARRARSTFRMEVMGKLEDENGVPYPGVATRQLLEKATQTVSLEG